MPRLAGVLLMICNFICQISGQNKSYCNEVTASTVHVVCQGEEINSVPASAIPDGHIDALTISFTSIQVIENEDFLGKSIAHLDILDNEDLSILSPKAFKGLQNVTSIRLNRNNLVTTDTCQSIWLPFYALDRLQHLQISDNNLNFSMMSNCSWSFNVTPFLELVTLDLKRNPVHSLNQYSFMAFWNSPLKYLNLESCEIQSIRSDAFASFRHLETLVLFNNQKLFHSFPPTLKFYLPRSLKMMDIGGNQVSIVMKHLFPQTLVSLSLDNNVFVELGYSSGKSTFPLMSTLSSLSLQKCRIQKIHPETFHNMPVLQELDLSLNPLRMIPPAVILPYLKVLKFQGLDGMIHHESSFEIEEKIFENNSEMSLKQLSLSNFIIRRLSNQSFTGLNNLKSLILDKISVAYTDGETFSSLTSLEDLALTRSSGLQIDLAIFLNDSFLVNLNLSQSNEIFERIKLPSRTYIRSLDLSGCISSNELFSKTMTSVEVLNVSNNHIFTWFDRKLNESPNMKTFVMQKSHGLINITEAMLEDFENLTTVDLSNNDFICNLGVTYFYKMVKTKKSLDVIGFYYGEGYYCVDLSSGIKRSFRNFSGDAYPIAPGYPGSNGDQEKDAPLWKMILFPLIGCLATTALAATLAHLIHSNRWYLEYKWAKLKIKHQKMKNSSSEDDQSFRFDAFVSYNHADKGFVDSILLPLVESEWNLRLCVHERDFQVGLTVIENIVDCLESSRRCIIVMSSEYASSKWCKFEAQMALQMFWEDDRMKTILVIKRNQVAGHLLDKSLRSVLKLRTYLEWKDENESQDFKRTFASRLRLSLQ